jgi:hypothetical protein
MSALQSIGALKQRIATHAREIGISPKEVERLCLSHGLDALDTTGIRVKAYHPTNEVLQKWSTDLAADDKTPECDPGIQIALKIAIGPHGIPVELAKELNERAKKLDVDAGYLVSLLIRRGLQEHCEG